MLDTVKHICTIEGEALLHTPIIMNRKSTQVAARLTPEDRKELESVAAILDVPPAQIIREGIRSRVVELKKEIAEKQKRN